MVTIVTYLVYLSLSMEPHWCEETFVLSSFNISDGYHSDLAHPDGENKAWSGSGYEACKGAPMSDKQFRTKLTYQGVLGQPSSGDSSTTLYVLCFHNFQYSLNPL